MSSMSTSLQPCSSASTLTALGLQRVPQSWIELVSQAVSDEISPQDSEGQEQAWEECQPGRQVDVGLRLSHHVAPARYIGRDACAQEAETGLHQDRQREDVGPLNQQWSSHVGEDVDRKDAGSVGADGLCALYEVSFRKLSTEPRVRRTTRGVSTTVRAMTTFARLAPRIATKAIASRNEGTAMRESMNLMTMLSSVL